MITEKFYVGLIVEGEYPDGLVDWCNSQETPTTIEEIEPKEDGTRRFRVIEVVPPIETEEEKAERIARLKLTKREVFLGIYRAKEITPEQIKAQITDIEALIEFEYATEYYRGNPLINVVGATLGFTSEQLDKFFETNDYTVLLPEVEEIE